MAGSGKGVLPASGRDRGRWPVNPPECRGKGATVGDFHKEVFLLKHLGMQGRGHMCNIRVCILHAFVCLHHKEFINAHVSSMRGV